MNVISVSRGESHLVENDESKTTKNKDKSSRKTCLQKKKKDLSQMNDI